ncbi:pilus assembly protein [Tabrizicola piscis]|jgi:TadE-like protein|uniref:Pilus assembly protein n=2 Tax=Tabrizicola piscis TaxID=2494374 RepID=A0A3S8U451_9RHOB|nr:pilus assembly protein [Tabrizicola piscis]
MMAMRTFLADERGTATIEFVLLVPIILTIFFASFESSFYMIRSVMLERSVDIVVRDIRLGNLDNIDHSDLKELFCETSALVANIADCVDAMAVWMQPINTATFAMVAPPRYCVDRDEDIILEPTPGEFAYGSDNDIMLLRICLKEEPMFPTTIIGAGLMEGGEDDGSYAIVVTSVFVNEPG